MCVFVCVDTMLQVVDKLSRPYSLDSVILSLPKRVAEAILYMQDNLNTFNNKVSLASIINLSHFHHYLTFKP